jgi:hypothetical protein
LNHDELLRRIESKSITSEELLQEVKRDSNVVATIIEGTHSPKPGIRYGCSKALMDLSGEYPERLYPFMDSFTALLESKYRIIVWNTLAIIANLANVDENKRFDGIFERYYSFLDDPYMVTVANTVGNSVKIALAKPYLINKIVDELLRIENIAVTPHLTEECKRVIAEKVVESFDILFDKIRDKDRVVHYVKGHVGSSRKTLKLKAESFLQKRGIEPVQD